MSNRRAIIIGHRGQDGRLLTEYLLPQSYELIGIGRNSCEFLHDTSQAPPDLDLFDARSVARLIRAFAPNEVYYLAAHHTSSDRTVINRQSIAESIDQSYRVHVMGLVHVLEAMNAGCRSARLFYASSSLVFGDAKPGDRQDEQTPISPTGEYGLTKALGSQACRAYRDQHGMFVSVGILYNHESVFRPNHFLTRKVALAVNRIVAGSDEKLVLGSLDAQVDWGYAPDYVRTFKKILNLPRPDEFVVATGVAHTVRDLVEVAFGAAGLHWEDHVQVDPSVVGRSQRSRIGNPAKLQAATGCKPSRTFEQMVTELVTQSTDER